MCLFRRCGWFRVAVTWLDIVPFQADQLQLDLEGIFDVSRVR